MNLTLNSTRHQLIAASKVRLPQQSDSPKISYLMWPACLALYLVSFSTLMLHLPVILNTHRAILSYLAYPTVLHALPFCDFTCRANSGDILTLDWKKCYLMQQIGIFNSFKTSLLHLIQFLCPFNDIKLSWNSKNKPVWVEIPLYQTSSGNLTNFTYPEYKFL